MSSPYPPFAPYAAQQATPEGPDDARPSAIQIIEDEDLVNGIVGHVALVTGCTSGIGLETARALYAAGMTVYMTARTSAKGQPILDSIAKSQPSSKAAAKFLAEQSTLSILVCNAGIMACPWSTTVDGHETQFGTNHLAHFLLLQLLLPALEAGSAPEHHSRVVAVSSSGHRNFAPPVSGDYNFDDGKAYDPWLGYGQSKTANIWMANRLDRLYGGRGINGYSLHPGGIWTPLQRYVTAEKMAEWKSFEGVDKVVKSPAQGAATTVWAATAKCWEGKGGVYLEDCSVALPDADASQSGLLEGHANWVYDEEGEERLWKRSLELVGLTGK